MPTFTFENQGANSYLVYTITPNDKMDTMSMGMLVNNDIPGLAPMIYNQLDEQCLLKFQISSKVSVAQFLEGGAANKKQMVGLLSGIADALAAIEDYMLDIQYILLDANYMYIDVSSYQTQLICLPIMEQKNTVSLGDFLKNLIFNTQYDQSENCVYVAKMVNFLNRSAIVTPEAIRTLVHELQRESQESTTRSATAATAQTATGSAAAIKPAMPNQGRELYQPAAANAATPHAPAPAPTPAAPAQTLPQQNASMPSEQAAKPEKQITWFKLMCHYNKENAALYKAQKEQKKATKAPKKKKGKAEQQPQFAMPNMPSMPAQSAVSAQPPLVPAQSAKPTQPPLVPTRPAMSILTPTLAQPATPAPAQPAASPMAAQAPIPQPGNFADHSDQGFGETTILGGAGGFAETTLLGGDNRAAAVTPHLIRYKTNEKIMLSKPVFRIGKERSYVDYFIGDNAAVSRSHANIITRGQQYSIVDTNSTNHTFVNNQELVSNVEVALEHGSKFRLANEEFEFRLY